MIIKRQIESATQALDVMKGKEASEYDSILRIR